MVYIVYASVSGFQLIVLQMLIIEISLGLISGSEEMEKSFLCIRGQQNMVPINTLARTGLLLITNDSFCVDYCSTAAKPDTTKKKGKGNRVWDLQGKGKDMASLDVFNSSADQDKVVVSENDVCIYPSLSL